LLRPTCVLHVGGVASSRLVGPVFCCWGQSFAAGASLLLVGPVFCCRVARGLDWLQLVPPYAVLPGCMVGPRQAATRLDIGLDKFMRGLIPGWILGGILGWINLSLVGYQGGINLCQVRSRAGYQLG
jgi:hypothetical protein